MTEPIDRNLLLAKLESSLAEAYVNAMALVKLRDNSGILDHEAIEEKAREQAIDCIMGAESRSGTEGHLGDAPDDNGQAVGGYLQTVLMMAVLMQSNIFD